MVLAVARALGTHVLVDLIVEAVAQTLQMVDLLVELITLLLVIRDRFAVHQNVPHHVIVHANTALIRRHTFQSL